MRKRCGLVIKIFFVVLLCRGIRELDILVTTHLQENGHDLEQNWAKNGVGLAIVVDNQEKCLGDLARWPNMVGLSTGVD